MIKTFCTGRWVEFFEDEYQRLSMSRLLMFLSFFPSSYVVKMQADKPDVHEVLMYYIGGYVLGYVGGKGVDMFTRRAEIKANSMQPPPNVTINQPDKVNVAN